VQNFSCEIPLWEHYTADEVTTTNPLCAVATYHILDVLVSAVGRLQHRRRELLFAGVLLSIHLWLRRRHGLMWRSAPAPLQLIGVLNKGCIQNKPLSQLTGSNPILKPIR
jgi:hypothetical protein